MLNSKEVLQVLNAAHGLAIDVGAKTLSEALDMRPAMVSNRFNPSTETHLLGLGHAIVATLDTGDTRILAAFAKVAGFRLEPIDATPVDRNELLAAVLELDSAKGELARQLSEAIEDGVISPREEQELAARATELRELIDRLQLKQGTVK
ncbi:phage regulatory CII family protein [Ferrimonas aestuarii]|uniref:Phage regulatory protein CII (CP76) n=1 Tax=Ferrimonas aestuarii TaxID=2569539 RepID=A0A4U1BL57_9GAMM|nr:phage regulatory CII family protein [Ferrimonas aestuarii]TKB53284.1 hypothetical protein FCL42_14525 [Ferrimonas aestuarii]